MKRPDKTNNQERNQLKLPANNWGGGGGRRCHAQMALLISSFKLSKDNKKGNQ